MCHSDCVTEQPQPVNDPAVYQPVPYQSAPMLEADARLWAMLINVASIAGAVLTGGLLGVVAVLVIWLIYRERSALIDYHGKQQLNLNISLLGAGIVAVIGTLVTFFIGGFVLIPALIAYGIYLLVVSILAAVAANKGEYYRIPLIVSVIK